MRLLASLALVLGCLLGSATPSQADPVDDIIAALTEDQIHHAPGAIAYLDEAVVRPELTLHPGRPGNEREARRQAELAEKYVLFLRDYEAGDAAEDQLSEMEQEVTR